MPITISFDLLNSATTASGVKRSFASNLDVTGLTIARLYGNTFLDLQIPNVSASGITWTLAGDDDPVVLGWVSIVDGSTQKFYNFENVLCYNITSNTWRISGKVQQVSPENSFD